MSLVQSNNEKAVEALITSEDMKNQELLKTSDDMSAEGGYNKQVETPSLEPVARTPFESKLEPRQQIMSISQTANKQKERNDSILKKDRRSVESLSDAKKGTI